MILVGDSAAMTIWDLPNTLGIGMEEMVASSGALPRR